MIIRRSQMSNRWTLERRKKRVKSRLQTSHIPQQWSHILFNMIFLMKSVIFDEISQKLPDQSTRGRKQHEKDSETSWVSLRRCCEMFGGKFEFSLRRSNTKWSLLWRLFVEAKRMFLMKLFDDSEIRFSLFCLKKFRLLWNKSSYRWKMVEWGLWMEYKRR